MGEWIRMPKLGMTMTEGQITRWLVHEGQTIEKGDYLFEVETDKTTLEVDSLYTGVLRKIYYEDMSVVTVNLPVAFIGSLEEEIPAKESFQAEPETEQQVTATLNITTDKTQEQAQRRQDTIRHDETKTRITYDYDLIVIGAGPGGYVAAIRAAQLGASVAVIEKNNCGGTCLNRGCIPTKAFFEKAKEWQAIQDANKSGFHIDNASFDWKKILAFKDSVVKRLVKGVGFLLEKNKIKLIYGVATLTAAHQVTVGEQNLSARSIVLATGGKPVMRIPADEPLLSTDEILSLETLPGSIVIIGGGVIGCEMAHILRTFGVAVKIVELMPRILPMMDEELSSELAKRLKADGVQILTNTGVERVARVAEGYSVLIASGTPLTCDLVLEAIGRKNDPDAYAGVDLETTERGFIQVDETYRTSIQDVYAIGDCNGISQLAHSASHQGIQLAEYLFGKAGKQRENTGRSEETGN